MKITRILSNISHISHNLNEGLASAIKKDHDHVRFLFNQFKNTSNPLDMKRIGNEIIRQLCLHSVAEEIVVYPMIKERLGEKIHHQSVAEHDVLKQDLNELFKLSEVKSEKYHQKLTVILEEFINHATKEENEVIPKLIKDLSKEKENILTRDFIEKRDNVPTRPHPSVTNNRLIENILCKLQVPIDKTLDKVTRDFVESK